MISAMPSANAIRKATNVTVEATLLATAKSLKIDISQAAEEGIARAVAANQEPLWLEKNQAALQSSNDHVDHEGLPLARFRNF